MESQGHLKLERKGVEYGPSIADTIDNGVKTLAVNNRRIELEQERGKKAQTQRGILRSLKKKINPFYSKEKVQDNKASTLAPAQALGERPYLSSLQSVFDNPQDFQPQFHNALAKDQSGLRTEHISALSQRNTTRQTSLFYPEDRSANPYVEVSYRRSGTEFQDESDDSSYFTPSSYPSSSSSSLGELFKDSKSSSKTTLAEKHNTLTSPSVDDLDLITDAQAFSDVGTSLAFNSQLYGAPENINLPQEPSHSLVPQSGVLTNSFRSFLELTAPESINIPLVPSLISQNEVLTDPFRSLVERPAPESINIPQIPSPSLVTQSEVLTNFFHTLLERPHLASPAQPSHPDHRLFPIPRTIPPQAVLQDEGVDRLLNTLDYSEIVAELDPPPSADHPSSVLAEQEHPAFSLFINLLPRCIQCQNLEGGSDQALFSSSKDLLHAFEDVLSNRILYRKLLNSKGETAQLILDSLQWALALPDLEMKEKSRLLRTMALLSGRSTLYPRCLILKDVVREDSAVTAGHFGEIWRGIFRNQTVCLKVAKVYQQSHADHLLKVFSKEAILWSYLSHPNLLPFYGIYYLDDTHNRVCLVSPWMDNGNVVNYLTVNPTTDRSLLILDIASGIEYLHRQGIVHGDLKGVNILVTPAGRACLADFGLSSLVDAEILRWTSIDSTASKGGTVRWQAPELFDPNDEDSPPTKGSDVYAFACVCYEVLTGLVPFHECPRDSTVMMKVMTGHRPSHPSGSVENDPSTGFPRVMWNLMGKCWDRDPLQRPVIQGVLAELLPFATVVDHRPTEDLAAFSPSIFRSALYESNRVC